MPSRRNCRTKTKLPRGKRAAEAAPTIASYSGPTPYSILCNIEYGITLSISISYLNLAEEPARLRQQAVHLSGVFSLVLRILGNGSQPTGAQIPISVLHFAEVRQSYVGVNVRIVGFLGSQVGPQTVFVQLIHTMAFRRTNDLSLPMDDLGWVVTVFTRIQPAFHQTRGNCRGRVHTIL